MSKWRRRASWRKGKAEWNEICWGGDHNLREGGRGERKAYPLSHLEKAREGGGGGLHPSGELLEQIV